MHPRVSVSQVSSWNWSLDEDLAFYEEAGIEAVGLAYRKLAATGDPVDAAERVVRSGLRVTNLLVPGPFSLAEPERWPDQREAAGLIMDTALALRPEMVVFTTGPAGDLTWERAADALQDAMRGTIAEAEREGLHLVIEHTNPLRADIGFVHSLRDAIELGWRLDMGVCMEISACWAERNLEGTISAGVDAINLVQVSDYVIGTHQTPDRAVPGDGDIPLRRIIRHLLEAGYTGVFDIEVIGPRIEEEGYRSAIGRSIAWLEETLEELEPG